MSPSFRTRVGFLSAVRFPFCGWLLPEGSTETASASGCDFCRAAPFVSPTAYPFTNGPFFFVSILPVIVPSDRPFFHCTTSAPLCCVWIQGTNRVSMRLDRFFFFLVSSSTVLILLQEISPGARSLFFQPFPGTPCFWADGHRPWSYAFRLTWCWGFDIFFLRASQFSRPTCARPPVPLVFAHTHSSGLRSSLLLILFLFPSKSGMSLSMPPLFSTRPLDSHPFLQSFS